MKDSIGLYIDNISQQLHAMSDDIFDHPEIGEQEFRTSKTITSFLESQGFSVEMGVGGMETAFRATYANGDGGPSIGFLCEYDAINGRGHICGHHTEGPGICGAVIALKAQLKELPYKLVVYGTPAEETYGEFFDVPKPDDNIFIGWFSGGEVFRSGLTFTRGLGKIFYFQPGHETNPTFYNKDYLTVVKNAIQWANPGREKVFLDAPWVPKTIES